MWPMGTTLTSLATLMWIRANLTMSHSNATTTANCRSLIRLTLYNAWSLDGYIGIMMGLPGRVTREAEQITPVNMPLTNSHVYGHFPNIKTLIALPRLRLIIGYKTTTEYLGHWPPRFPAWLAGRRGSSATTNNWTEMVEIHQAS